MEHVLALKEPDLLLIVEPCVETLLTTTAAALKLCETFGKVLNFDIGVCLNILRNQGTRTLQDRFKVTI